MDPILTSTPVQDSSPLSDTICSPESPDSPTLDISLLTSVDEELNVSDAEESDDSTLCGSQVHQVPHLHCRLHMLLVTSQLWLQARF